jgi:hypothetical protein
LPHGLEESVVGDVLSAQGGCTLLVLESRLVAD